MALTLDGTNGETFPTWTTAGRPASPNTGQTGFNTTLSALEYYDGTNWKQNYITSGTAQNSTSGTSIDFTGIPAGVKRITVMFSGVSTNGTSPVILQLGKSGGVETSNYLGAALASGSTSNLSAGFRIDADGTTAGAAFVRHGMAMLVLLDAATNTWAGTVSSGRSDSGIAVTSSGSKALSGTLDRVRITTVNGTDTFDAGSINIMYE